jgi:hypothetical protein
MKRLALFGTRRAGNQTPFEGAFFMTRQTAKFQRNDLAKQTGKPYVVSPGPDHWKNKK